jgi:hypothetical protein
MRARRRFAVTLVDGSGAQRTRAAAYAGDPIAIRFDA